MGHRNPNHKGTLVGELNIVREKGYLYFCYDSENFENKICLLYTSDAADDP